MAREERAVRASALIKTHHAIISITDPDSDFPHFAPNENRLGILSLRFYDLDDISNLMAPKDAVEYLAQFGHGLFKDDQAPGVLDFMDGFGGGPEGIFVQCARTASAW